MTSGLAGEGASNVTDDARSRAVIVTGAQRGIGLAIAEAFARAGHATVIADVTDDLAGSELAERWGVTVPVLAERCDISVPAEVEALLDRVEKAFGAPALHLVNNAAVQFWSAFEDLDHEDFRKTLEVNVGGTFLTSQRWVRRRIAAGGGGTIVNLGSGCNTVAFPMLSAYVASKGAIETLTKSMALELGRHGIRVNCVAPGAIETERTRAETEGYAGRWAPLTPLGRVGTVEDVAAAIVALTGPDFSFTSGRRCGWTEGCSPGRCGRRGIDTTRLWLISRAVRRPGAPAELAGIENSQPRHQSQSFLDGTQFRLRQSSYLFRQERLVERRYLRDVHHGFLLQSATVLR